MQRCPCTFSYFRLPPGDFERLRLTSTQTKTFFFFLNATTPKDFSELVHKEILSAQSALGRKDMHLWGYEFMKRCQNRVGV